VKAVIENL